MDAVCGFRNQSELAAWAYVCMDVFVLPSRSETWGLVLNEAMLFQLPVIASSMVGATEDLIDTGKNGFVFDVGDVRGGRTRGGLSSIPRRCSGCVRVPFTGNRRWLLARRLPEPLLTLGHSHGPAVHGSAGAREQRNDTLMERWKERGATYTRTAPTSDPACAAPAHERQQYLRRAIRSFLPRDLAAPILDIGCGTGGFLDALRSVGYSCAEGVDLSASQYRRPRRAA